MEKLSLSCSWLWGNFLIRFLNESPQKYLSNMLPLNLKLLFVKWNSNLTPACLRSLWAFIKRVDWKISPQPGTGQGYSFLSWMAAMWARRFFDSCWNFCRRMSLSEIPSYYELPWKFKKLKMLLVMKQNNPSTQPILSKFWTLRTNPYPNPWHDYILFCLKPEF